MRRWLPGILLGVAGAGLAATLGLQALNAVEGRSPTVASSQRVAEEPPIPVSTRPLGEGELESPTGRRPLAIWTGRRQAVWALLRAQQHPSWRVVQERADASGTKRQAYADLGQWATVAFQVTGHPAYAQQAWGRIERKLAQPPPNRNFTREHFMEFAWMYDWLKPALSPEQQQRYIEGMNAWCLYLLDRVPKRPFGTRPGDSDELVGHYFGLALWAAVSGAENPTALKYFHDPMVGGFSPTGGDSRSWRNALRHHARLAEGGVWLESSKYNLGTLRLLLFGAEALRTATGHDHFPEVTALIDQIAAAQLHELTSDLRQAYQWGDEEEPRSQHLERRANLLAMLTGLGSPKAAGRTLNLMAHLGYFSLGPREFALFDPTHPLREWTDQPTFHAARGMGMVFARDGWWPGGAFFGAHLPGRPGVDHEVRYFGDFQLYRRGEWVLTHPLGYDATEAQYINGMLLGGWSSMREARGLLDAGQLPDGTVWAVGATAGQPYLRGYGDPPPTFLHEWTRSLVYVPSPDGRVDVIVVHDRTRVQDPRRLSGYERHRAQDRKRMDRELARGVKQWILHLPLIPAIDGQTISWRTPGGQPVRVVTLLPQAVTHLLLDEQTDVPMTKYVRGSERRWQVRVLPAQAQEWDTFLHVLIIGEAPVEASLVREGDREGVRLRRGEDLPEKTILFPSAPGERLGAPKTAGGKLVYTKGLLKRFAPLARVEIR